MFKRIVICCLAVVAASVVLFGLVGCGLFPTGGCDHHYEIVSTTGDCYKDGEIVKQCKDCGYIYTDINPKGHKYTTIERVPATCFEDGYYVQECSRCHQIDRGTLAKGHNYVEIESTVTCEADGIVIKECSACGNRVELTETALGHYPVPIGTPVTPTCSHDGITAGSKCARCNAVLEEQIVLPKEHKLDSNLRCEYCGVIFKKYNVTLNLGDGSEPVVKEYIHGSTIDFPAVQEKENFVFIGWYIDDKKCSNDYAVDQDVTVVAKFEPIIGIRDADGLQAIADKPDGFYKLLNDINMRGESLPVIGEFSGILDGDGHIVRDAILTANASVAGEYFGFIRVNKGTVKNITFSSIGYSVSSEDGKYRCGNNWWGVITGRNSGTLENVKLLSSTAMLAPVCAETTSPIYFGCLAGVNLKQGKITDCEVNADVSNRVSFRSGWDQKNSMGYGGVVGINYGVISKSSFVGTINSQITSSGCGLGWSYDVYPRIGGIVGLNSGSEAVIEKSYVSVINKAVCKGSEGTNEPTLGGVAGFNGDGARIGECSAAGTIHAETNCIGIAGGLVGENASTGRVNASHSSADVFVKSQNNSAVGYAGGFIGKNSAIAQKCYATGDVTTVNRVSAGGFVGGNMSSGTIRYSYSTGDITASKEENKYLGAYGYFAGASESASVLYECRYLFGARLMRDGDYVEKTDATGSNGSKSISDQLLWTEDFLAEQFNWDTDDGWVIFNDDNPLLVWELERGHNFESKVIAPTHEYGGFTAYHCSDCGRVYISNFINPLGHTYEHLSTVAPTCTEQGYDVVHCTKDGCDFDGEVHINFTPATGHSKGEHAEPVSTEKAATCGEIGSGAFLCDVCGASFTADIPATGAHTWVDVDEQAAVACASNKCGEEGHSAYRVCSTCGLIDGKTILTPHIDANKDNVCDMCKGFTFTTVSKNDFIEISTAAGLVAIGNDLSKNYKLTRDIDLTGTEWQALGSKNEPFTGILYGNGHSIIGLTANVDSVNGVALTGLFAYNRGKIIGVTLNGFTMNAQNSNVVFGGIAAYNYGEIINCVIRGNNMLQYYSSQKIVSSNSNSSRSYVYMLTAGGFAGVNGAGGHVVGCIVEGSLVSKNAVYGEISLNIGSTIWSAGGALLNNIIFDTQLSITQNVTFGGLVGTNSGEVSDCKVTGSVNVYSYADANLVQLKGKLIVKTELYAGSLIGYNTGNAMGNAAPAISYDIPSEYKNIGIPYIVTGKAYELTYAIVNHGSEGNGKIGFDATV